MAQVIDYGSDTYTATCVRTSRVATVPHRAADPVNEAAKQRKPSVRVLFFFPDDTSEGRYMYEPPRLGHQVRSPGGTVWTVVDVFHTGLDTYTVTCAPPQGGGRDLAADLLEPARNSISRLINYGRTVPMPIDQNMTDLPWVKLPPEAPNASDAPTDSQDTSGEQGGDGADRRKHENKPVADALASQQLVALARVSDLFGEEGIAYWLFGGWAVDFYAGSVTRAHDDVDIAVWLEDLPRIAKSLERHGWRHAPSDDEDGGTGYECEAVRLELIYFVRDPDGGSFTPRRRGRGAWSMEALANDVGELRGVRSRLVGLTPLMRAKSSPRDDPEEAAKDNADFEQLSRVGTTIERQ
ncbi:hypothetical protein BH18ACT13_BH18ACT13_09380 [soil metagenome]